MTPRPRGVRGRFGRVRSRGARSRQHDERGYAALLVATLVPTLFLGLCAIALDVARWYLELERVQKAADAAALAGVTYMPYDLLEATRTAETVSSRNGYAPSSDVSIDVAPGPRQSQLEVTVSSRIPNTWGALLGVGSITVSRTAIADYSGPAPMGSPCNTFGNEPPSLTGSVLPAVPVNATCRPMPEFWAAVEGPGTAKLQGDRYGTLACNDTSDALRLVDGCSPTRQNSEYDPAGYFFLVKVQPEAVGRPIQVEVYDPAFVYTNVRCQNAPSRFATGDQELEANMNPFVGADAAYRYGSPNTSGGSYSESVYTTHTRLYCSGDYFPGVSSTTPPTTSFVLREQTDTGDPMRGAPITGCTKQFRGQHTAPTGRSLRRYRSDDVTANSQYNQQLARVFHTWVPLCIFTPTRSGDYYLQVRTNVSLGGTPTANTNSLNPVVYDGNPAAAAATGNTTAGVGLNSFALRARTQPGLEGQVAVSGWDRMPILQNATGSTAEFNLVRVLPGARGQTLEFEFFDAADASGAGTVQVLRPTDATGSIATTASLTGCTGSLSGGPYAPLVGCTVPVSNLTHNGTTQVVRVRIPQDYDCQATSLGGCWFRVAIAFTGATVTDFTTWDASVNGDPVRLVE